jgi:hypothetical protein
MMVDKRNKCQLSNCQQTITKQENTWCYYPGSEKKTHSNNNFAFYVFFINGVNIKN